MRGSNNVKHMIDAARCATRCRIAAQEPQNASARDSLMRAADRFSRLVSEYAERVISESRA